MELKVDIPSLAGQEIDPAAFQRVWNRVMPDQNAPTPRSDAGIPPVTIPDTSVPAEPSVPPETPPPAEPAPPLPPVPDCPTCPACPPQQECPACPECPVCPECPPQQECPACPVCPECPPQQTCPVCPECPPQQMCPVCPECPPQQTCPICPECPPSCTGPCPPVLCLGEDSRGDSRRLETLMALAKEGSLAGQALARRSSGSCAKALASLARDHRMALRRLSAAYFLITGQRCTPKCSAPCLPSSLPLGLRQQFGWEQRWEQQNCQAAQETSDPCLKELYLELAQEGAFHAGSIRSLLEQMA